MPMKLTTIILIALLFCSCKNEKTQSIITIDVQAPNGHELKNLSEIATDIQYIPLETNPKALMRFVNYLKATDEKYYINTVLELLCFDKTGKFLYKLDKQGRGPEEYTYLADYDILPEKKLVMVLASSSGKLFLYNETDSGFQYIKKLDLKIRPQYCDFIPNQDNILLSFGASTGENKYQCIVINQNGDTILKRPNYFKFTRLSKVQMGFSSDNIINITNDILRIKGLLSDTMFTLTKEYDFVPYMIMNTGGKGVTPDFLSNIPAPVVDGGSPAAKFLQISAILETDRYMLHNIYFQKTGFWGVYDKTSGETHYFKTENLLKDDISGGINIEPKFCYDGILYSWTDALTFKEYMSDNIPQNQGLKNPKRAAELQKMAESIKEDDNHILIVITPKK
jgi:hypothetical protein